MNRLALQQNTRALKNMIDKITPSISGRGMYFKVKEVNTGDLVLNKSGIYVMCGLNEQTVCDFSSLDPDSLYEIAVSQEAEVAKMYPKCSVFQFTSDNQLLKCADMLDHVIMFEFLRDKAKDFGIKNLPSKIDEGLLDLSMYYYSQSLKLKYPDHLRHELYKSCKNLFDFFGSKYTKIEDYYNSKGNTSDKKHVPNWRYLNPKEYISKSPNCVESVAKLIRPNRLIAISSVPAQALPELEKLLTNKGIKYFINKEPVVVNDFGIPETEENKKLFFNDESFKKPAVYYMVQFDSVYTPFISGYTNAEIYDGLKDHAKHIPLITNSDKKYNAINIPAYWVESFIDYLKAEKINYIYDIDSTYTQSNTFEIGFVFDSEAEYHRAANIVIKIIEGKMEYHEIDRTLERASLGYGKEKEEALKELEARKNNS